MSFLNLGFIYSTGALFAWAALSFFIRLSMQNAPLLKVAALASTLNGIFVAILFFFTTSFDVFFSSVTTYLLIVVTGFMMIALSRLSYYYAIGQIGPSRTIPIAASTPAVSAYLASLFFGEPITLKMLLGLLILLIGVVYVVRSSDSLQNVKDVKSKKLILLGYLAAVATTLNWSLCGTMLKAISKDIPAEYGPFSTSMFVINIGCIFAWLLYVFFKPKEKQKRKFPKKNWKWLICAAICQTIAIPCYTNALSHTLVVNVNSITALQPLVVVIVSKMFLDQIEKINLKLIGGILMSVVGTIVILMSY
ncbi:MAG: DMT family transporter [Nitrospinota bacterium]|nr:DMT family transporter [Nitrospinota bacterium]